MGRSVALLDVDHTLLFDDRLNTKLLDSLKEKGVNDLFLFTDMMLKKSGIEDREKLIANLKARGFKVHGVITPLDLVWDKIPAEKAAPFRDYVFKHGPQRLFGNDFDSFLNSDELRHEYSFAPDSLNRSMSDVSCGIAYKEGIDAYAQLKDGHASIPNSIAERSEVAKILGDHIAHQAGYEHTKGLLLDAFLQNKPEWVSNIIIADDNQHVITSIAQYKEKHQPKLPISAIHVTNENLEKTAYQNKIHEHLRADPSYRAKLQIIQKIDKHINHLKRFNLFLSGSKAKINAFSRLKEDILAADFSRQTMEHVIDDWMNRKDFINTATKEKATNAQVLSQQRNIFKAEYRNKDTSSQEFVQQLLSKKEMKVALIDIDGCLVQNNQLNPEIIKRIKEENYDQVILFTQRAKFLQIGQISRKYILDDVKPSSQDIVTTEDAVQALQKQLGQEVMVSTSIDQYFGEPLQYYETSLKYFEQELKQDCQKHEEGFDQKKFNRYVSEELSILRQELQINDATMPPVEYFPQKKDEQYKVLLNHLKQMNPSANISIDFFDDRKANLAEVIQAKNIDIKPNCFIVHDQNIQSLFKVHQYAHFTDQQSKGRFHFFDVKTDATKHYKHDYQNLKGDYLKSQILSDYKKQLEATCSEDEVKNIKEKFKRTEEYKILAAAQGLFTKMTGIQTSSVRAVEKMAEDRISELYSGLKLTSHAS